MLKPRPSRVNALQKNILRWYGKNSRQLPWRKTNDPYRVLVSEIMLQQTQVSRVEQKFHHFIKQYPTLRALARTSRADVVRAWQGMGYNNRAIRLRDAARIVMEERDGRLPSDTAQLEKLPGIGRYTAHAIACFAYGQKVPVVDVNIRRVLSRIFRKMNNVFDLKPADEIWELAARILPENVYMWNQALMDLGAAICTAQKPLCESCPASNLCSSRTLYKNRAPGNARIRRSKKSEPMYAGIPQRFWRGRIVEALRKVNGEDSISLTKVGRTIKPDFAAHELPWLKRLAQSLIRDGVVERVKASRTTKIMLAKG
ncbi:MAG: A/G-specific adenine glycosylase [Ignavibacteriae bacterium]|nr:A/G-specific adenine glycosylase [Ignavibacteria bacterium]MBI3364129.1 A/G-specific adenine glycosylase [Ignavibacteriota bacterium]